MAKRVAQRKIFFSFFEKKIFILREENGSSKQKHLSVFSGVLDFVFRQFDDQAEKMFEKSERNLFGRDELSRLDSIEIRRVDDPPEKLQTSDGLDKKSNRFDFETQKRFDLGRFRVL